ncbi:hypothetical protein OG883_13245 [Streptomyces sp. NBC_01142]|uniref:hypothetical protein n=1 Tax=Streptomyces sp. NBC_01142 TaxID=2975865 RepID=UPI002259E85D|nr:hypothetical protein [Streptomyces sp. NBC_01142]MCX4820855.1 hypothetical protein [Streptomyces sp. NBC_01142]
MRAIRAASAALLGVASLGLATPLAAAATSVNNTPYDFTVTPSTVAPGGRVTLTAGGCNTTASASSGVFDSVTIPSNGSATATVDGDAKPGAVYAVSFACGSDTASLDMRISGTPARPTASSTTVAPQGVRGGLGGSIGGLNTGELAAGTALVVAAATGTIYVVRRRSESRQH